MYMYRPRAYFLGLGLLVCLWVPRTWTGATHGGSTLSDTNQTIHSTGYESTYYSTVVYTMYSTIACPTLVKQHIVQDIH